MTSVYNYITVALLEAYTGINYESTSATYTDVFVLAQISIAERVVNAMCVTTPSATSDGVIAATYILSERFMRNVMFIDDFAEEVKQSVKAFFDYLIKIILKADKYVPCGIVPMSGAEKWC